MHIYLKTLGMEISLIDLIFYITDKKGSQKTDLIPIVTGSVVSVLVITIVVVIVITVWKRRQR